MNALIVYVFSNFQTLRNWMDSAILGPDARYTRSQNKIRFGNTEIRALVVTGPDDLDQLKGLNIDAVFKSPYFRTFPAFEELVELLVGKQ